MNVKRIIIISIICVVLVSSIAAVSAGLFDANQKHEKAEIVISHGNDLSYSLDTYGDVPSQTLDWSLKFNDSYACYWVTDGSGYDKNITRVIIAGSELSPIDDHYYTDSDFRPLKIKCDIIDTYPLDDDSESFVAFVENVDFVEWV